MQILETNSTIIQQYTTLVKSMNSDEFVTKSKLLEGATIGQHVRHVLEFYMELIKGCDLHCAEVCYDDRKRHLELETNQSLVAKTFEGVEKDILNANLDKPIVVCSKHTSDEHIKTKSESSFHRELVYAMDHAIHHMAIIKLAMKVEFPQIKLNENMGIAPSTLRNRNLCAQ